MLINFSAQFLADVREVMGVPDWMLSIDSRSTKTRDEGECILMVIHFKGPQAHKFDQDFSRLMMTGKLEEPSIYIAGYINQKRKTKLSYRQCSGTKDRDDKRSKFFCCKFGKLFKSFFFFRGE